MTFSIDAEFPGGNILVESVDGESVYLSPDLRDTSTHWFYWCFRVTGAVGRTLKFVFDPKNMGVLGPAVSLDAGESWSWLGADSVKDGTFSYPFSSDSCEVRFSVGMPYLRANWDRFLTDYSGNPAVQLKALTHTREGRSVPMLFAGNADAPFAIAIIGRQHCCEMMASYALEGLVAGILAEDSTGKWLRENVSLLIVPFMDADGVENGDQGKNRAPHDHNRDYSGEPIYNEVRALKEQLPEWLDGRPFVTFDFHCPALKGAVHESIFFVEPQDRAQAARMDQLGECIQQAQGHSGLLRPPHKLAFGSGFNSTPASDKRTFSAWTGSLPHAVLATSLEVAYANALGSEVNAESARKLGRDFAQALPDWLTNCLPKNLTQLKSLASL